jgi:hypothetical protein
MHRFCRYTSGTRLISCLALQLTLLCGAEEKLVSVEEPSRCAYTAQLATPALCTHEDHAALRAQSEAAEAEAAAIRDEL